MLDFPMLVCWRVYAHHSSPVIFWGKSYMFSESMNWRCSMFDWSTYYRYYMTWYNILKPVHVPWWTNGRTFEFSDLLVSRDTWDRNLYHVAVVSPANHVDRTISHRCQAKALLLALTRLDAAMDAKEVWRLDGGGIGIFYGKMSSTWWF